jgi:hypothetical protein
MNKAIYNKDVPTRNMVTTLTGVIALVFSGLVLFGVFTPEVAADFQDYVTAIITAVAGIISIFKATDA